MDTNSTTTLIACSCIIIPCLIHGFQVLLYRLSVRNAARSRFDDFVKQCPATTKIDDDLLERGVECSICLCDVCSHEDQGNNARWRQLPCRHVFHVECIDPWIYKGNRCPTCRGEPLLQENKSTKQEFVADGSEPSCTMPSWISTLPGEVEEGST
eukprot:TRINITY_DN6176_c0_g1_i3.p1 TRINITY_DN6176_c0_g1~~TRINITY_DN6176_c0_g1_i3.p1  ORF type:complete len:155 (-),score=8.19 TRINITY_DN6176_c0_g1_i3:377-841(-)